MSPSSGRLRRDSLCVPPEQVVGEHVEYKHDDEGIYGNEPMPENESSNKSGYNRPTHASFRQLNCKVLEEHEKRRLVLLIVDRYNNVFSHCSKKLISEPREMSIHL